MSTSTGRTSASVPVEPGVYVAEAPPPQEPHGLTAVHRDDLSVIHVPAPTTDKKIAHAAMTVLWALGKREGVTGAHGHISENVYLLPIWLTAHHTRAVVVTAAQHWDRRLTQDLLRLIQTSGTTVVLVADHGRLPDVLDAATGYIAQCISLDDIQTTWAPPADPAKASQAVPDWSNVALPDNDWPTFRAHCRRHLSAPVFAVIDDHYRRALAVTRAALSAEPNRDDDNTRALLIDLIGSTTHRSEAAAVIRATQAAHFAAGYNLRVDLHEAISLLNQSRSIAFTAQDWRSLRAYRQPGRAATCVLYGAQLSVEQIEATTLGDAEQAVQTGSINGQPLPPDALAILRAATLERTLDGAQTNEPLIVCSRVATMLTNAAKDLGILVASTANRRSQHTANFWHYRLGFTLQRID